MNLKNTIEELSDGKRSAPRKQLPADGFCGVCDKAVPASYGNRFYCGETCRRAAFNHYHPHVGDEE